MNFLGQLASTACPSIVRSYHFDMSPTLDDKLVVAISSRALFDLEEENRLFESGDPEGYMRVQLERLDLPARPGIAHAMVRKLLRFNEDGVERVKVVILSRRPT